MKKISLAAMALILLLLVIMVMYSYSLKAKSSTLANGANFEPQSCWFDHSFFPNGVRGDLPLYGLNLKRIECGYLRTRKEEGKSFFRLPIIIVRDSFWKNSEKPVINIAGGPGAASWLDQDSIDNFWLPSIQSNNWHHDMVLFDARGTGMSEPALHCDSFFKDSLSLLGKALGPEEEASANYKMLKRCRESLLASKTNFDALHHLGTQRSANDIADLGDLLQIDAWHLYGTSYGTRLALEVERKHPTKVSSMILDSVYPQEIDGEETMPDLFVDAVEGMLKACDDEPTCALQFSQLQEKLHVVLKRLSFDPVELILEFNDEPVDYVVTAARFYTLLYDAGYDINSVIEVPNVIQSLYVGRLEALQMLAQNSLDMMLDESFSNPVYMEVECNENEVRDKQAFIEKINRKYAPYPILKRWQMASLKKDLCKLWGNQEADEQFHQPVQTNKPTLVLGGVLDSATPAKWSRDVAQRLPNSEYHEFKASAHAVLYNVPCSKSIVRRFLNPDKQYPPGCQSDNPFYDGQRVVWSSSDSGDFF